MENTAENRLGPDLALDAAYQPATYGKPKTGKGRWCILYANGGQDQLGFLWQGANGGLGFVPSSDAGIQRNPEFYAAFSKAAGLKVPSITVFNDYAGRAGLGLSAGPVEEGDLDTLPA